jgi:hypothetical protein
MDRPSLGGQVNSFNDVTTFSLCFKSRFVNER